MNRFILPFAVALTGIALFTAATNRPETPAPAIPNKLVHVVAFKFKADAPKEGITRVEREFAGLKGKIQEIADFEWGTNVSPEKLDKGFTHCFVVTFRNEKDRDAYLVHPEHKKFVEIVGPVVEDVFVIDYFAKRQ